MVANFCKPGSMSRCTAGKSWKDQNRCFFAEKSTDLNRCMFYMFDEYCDCVKAQQAEYNPVESGTSLNVPILERVPERTIKDEIQPMPRPIDVKKRATRKICPIDYTTICSKNFCNQWNWCKDPFKHKL